MPLSTTLPSGSFDEFSLGGSLLGIDEAGRGPVIGPLVVCGFSVKEPAQLHKLREIGVKDSKALPATKREKIFEQLQNFQFETVIIHPAEIDQKSITELTLQAAGKIFARFKAQTVIFDAPAPPAGIPAMAERIKEIFRKTGCDTAPRLILENEADAKYLICMAASIVAKVTRDREIKKLQAEFGDFGSGYCSDPKTIKFLKSFTWNSAHRFFRHIRHKWNSVTVRKTGIKNIEREPALVPKITAEP